MNPDINNIQYHDGVHRFLPPRLRRPLNSPLTSTLEVITSKEFVKDSCVHRSDVKELHNTANEYGQCVICISVMSENRTTLDMVVRDRAMGGDIPSRFYKLPLPIMQGLNHITWCSDMNLKVMGSSILGGLIESDQHYMHARLDAYCGPAIFFPSMAPPASRRYWRHWSGVYHLDTSDWLFPRISHKYLIPYEHRPHCEPIFDNRHDVCGVDLIPSCMDLLSSPRQPSSLWVQAWAATGTDGVGILREDGILPPFLQPTYIHLRYKPCE